MEGRARAVSVVWVDGRIVGVEQQVGMDEFMMVEGQGGKYHVQEQMGQRSMAMIRGRVRWRSCVIPLTDSVPY